MIRTATAAVLAGLISTFCPPTVVAGADWRIDPDGSRLGFTATQGGAPFEGVFRRFDAHIRFDPADPSSGKVEIVIATGSIDTGNSQRDETAKGGDWFSIESFPEARFAAENFRSISAGRFEAEGRLTLRNISRPVTLPFTLTETPAGTRAKGELVITRTDYDIGGGPWANPQTVGLEVTIRFDLLATRIR